MAAICVYCSSGNDIDGAFLALAEQGAHTSPRVATRSCRAADGCR